MSDDFERDDKYDWMLAINRSYDFDDDDDYYYYDDDGYYDYDEYYEPQEPPTRWQRVKAWFNTLWWRISSKFRPNEFDDIPF